MESDLVRLTYASTATFAPNQYGGIEVEVGRILTQSRRNNRDRQVGGVLHYGQGYFFQALEGERQAVNETYARIEGDPRHRDVKTLSFNPVSERLFQDWSMKYVPVQNHIQALLERHGIPFDPYRFNHAFIEEFLALCVQGQDPTAGEQAPGSGAGTGAPAAVRPWWKRLIGA